MQDQNRDRWDKADIILKPVGGLLTALAVAALGPVGASFKYVSNSVAAPGRLPSFTSAMPS